MLLWVTAFTLATCLAPSFIKLHSESSTSILVLLMGDSRQMFAGQFFAKADAYFHNGNYPSIFDHQGPKESHMTEQAEVGREHKDDDNDEHAKTFTGDAPKDWIERFGRNFIYKQHSHLENEDVREILPWLKLATEMDPHQVTVYVTAAYWLRVRLHKPDEAEKFLREGLRDNRDSPEILFELGTIYYQDRHDDLVSRNLWLEARKKWLAQKDTVKKTNELVFMRILGSLAKLAEKQGHTDEEIQYLEELKQISPNSDAIEILIQSARKSASQKK